MKKISTLFVLLSVLLIASNFFIVSCPDDDDDATPTPTNTPTVTPTPEPDIIPGEKMYNLFIRDTFKTCSDQYGEPDSYDCFEGLCIAMYIDPFLFLGLTDSNNNSDLDDSDIINAIGITNFTYWYGKTAGGNGIGSSRDSIIGEFGPCEYSDIDECTYPSIGIWWAFVNSAECDLVMVQRPFGAGSEIFHEKAIEHIKALQ